mgnify:CR=1 FL=1
MAAAGFFKSLRLRYFAKPAYDRRLYSLIRRHKIGQIVELGVAQGQRSIRMIELAQRYHEGEVRYTGIDLFEARQDDAPGLSLKQAYTRMRATGAKVQLIPGDPFSSLARSANSLTGTQLLLISADQDAASLDRAWFYVPRMLADGAHVLVEHLGDDPAKAKYELLSRDRIDVLAGANQQRRRAA